MSELEQESPVQSQTKENPSCGQIIIGLHNGGTIVLQTSNQGIQPGLSGMRELMCLKEEGNSDHVPDSEIIRAKEMPEKRHVMHHNPMTEIAYSEDRKRFYVAGWIRNPKDASHYQRYIWQTGLIFAGMNAILRGEKAVLVHCTALETERGAVVLFGESGMGKSTASARWRAHGGKCISDDMALLDFTGGETVYVRRMPTWSACRDGKNEWNYPAAEELPLIGVLALGRNESGDGGDKIVELSAAQFYAQCFRSMFYWNLFYCGKLPEELQQRLGNRIRELTNIITGKYPPRALLTVLEGNPIHVIETYLESLETR